ncbi:MAG: dTDP-4-dehydrorhamnose reductase [Deltaproteobacteria bacterium]|nr:dTDP-4-dehydrorhamnose reductase [Deltaproteobacteria bacterium]
MKVIVTGCNGQVGKELCKKSKEYDLEIISLDLPDFDITDMEAVDEIISKSNISAVINAAAYTAVDKAESEPDIAFNVNQKGPAYLAASCRKQKIPLIHISTDYVFDGSKIDAYIETDPVSPVGVYGKSKAAGEADVRKILAEHVILRTAWLCSEHGNNFVKTMIRLGQERNEIGVVADQYGCPTFANDIAEALLDIVGKIAIKNDIAWGTYHYCGKGVTTWYGFAKEILELAGEYTGLKVRNIVPLTTKEYPTPAKRPANSALDCTLLKNNFNIFPKPWQNSLDDLVKRLFDYSADE